MHGNLRQWSLADVLRTLYSDDKSGILRVSGPKGEQRIHLKDGKPLYCDAADRPAQSREESENVFFPLFALTEGEFSFEEIVVPIDDDLAFTTPPAQLILEGSRRVNDAASYQSWLGGPESVLECAQTAELPVFQIKLNAEEKAILALADERKRFKIADIHLEGDRIVLLRALYSLVALGLVELMEKAEPGPEDDLSIPPLPDLSLGERTGAVPEHILPPKKASVEELLETFEEKVHPAKPAVHVPPVGRKELLFRDLGTAAVAVRSVRAPWAKRASLAFAGVALVIAVWLLVGPEPGAVVDGIRSAFGVAQASPK